MSILTDAGERRKADVSNVTEEDLRAHAQDIEEELFLHLSVRDGRSGTRRCGTEYKSKFRSLMFNLNDKKNDSLRFRVLAGQVTPRVLVRMSNEDMANEELRTIAEDVRKRSIRDSVIADV
ncbi:transcription elongation factor S-II, partial [Thamnocephalis sphaerospora]